MLVKFEQLFDMFFKNDNAVKEPLIWFIDWLIEGTPAQKGY